MTRTLLLGVMAIALIHTSSAQAAEPTAEAMRLYRQQRYDEAAQQLQSALQQRPDDPTLYYDLGTVAHAKGDYQAAEEAFNKALASADAGLLGRTWYNLGNTHYRQGQMKEATAPGEAIALYRRALDDYRGAIRQIPNDKDARYNYELVERRMKSLMQRQEQGQGTRDGGLGNKGEEQKAEGSEQGAGDGGQGTEDHETRVTGHGSREEQDQAQTPAAAVATGEGEPEKADGEQQGAESAQQQDGEQQEALQQEQSAGGEEQGSKSEEREAEGSQQSSEEDGTRVTSRESRVDEKGMSQQEAFWILDSMQQEERGVPRGQQRGPARERPVEQDW